MGDEDRPEFWGLKKSGVSSATSLIPRGCPVGLPKRYACNAVLMTTYQ